MTELKPCPFCGGEAKLMKMGYPHWIYCQKCGARVHGGTVDAKDSVKAWNRRTSDPDDIAIATLNMMSGDPDAIPYSAIMEYCRKTNSVIVDAHLFRKMTDAWSYMWADAGEAEKNGEYAD